MTWDKAMRGVHKDAIYNLGLVPLVKTARAPGGPDKTRLIEQTTVTARDGTKHTLPVYAVNGALGMETIVGGTALFVPFERTKTLHRPARWYNEYRVPDLPQVPHHLRGATGRCRLDTTREDQARNLNRAEVLSAIPTIDPDWDRLYIRNHAESVNALIKRKWWKDLAPAVGRPRQHFALLCAALLINYRSLLNHTERVRGPRHGPTLSAPPPPQRPSRVAHPANSPPAPEVPEVA